MNGKTPASGASGRISSAAPAGKPPLPGLGSSAGDLIARVVKLEQQGELEAALALIEPRLANATIEPVLVKAACRLLLKLERPAEAQALLNGLKPAQDDAEQWALRAAAAQQAERFDEAMDYTARYCALAPIIVTNSRRDDFPVIGVVTSSPTTISLPTPPGRLHFQGNFLGQYAKRNLGPYRLVSLLADAKTAARAQEMAPRPVLVINHIVVGELLVEHELMSAARKAIRRWGCDTINKPEHAAATARDKLSAALRDVPGVRAPRIEYIAADGELQPVLDRIERDFGFPVILRAPFFNYGHEMHLVRNRAEAQEIADRLKPGFYAIEFIENQPRSGLFRRIRAAFVEQELHVLRLDYLPSWMVHSHRNTEERRRFYEDNPQFLEEEAAVCRDPVAELGEGVVAALRRIRQVVKLDYFGIDFDVDSDGRVIVFEANAAMNLLSWHSMLIKHPQDCEQALIESFNAMLARRIG